MREFPTTYTARPERVTAPTRSYTHYNPPRPLREWIEEGQVVEGHEPNGTAFSYDVLASMNRGGVPQFVVVGKADYGDGRWFLDFGISLAYIEATSDFRERDGILVWVCPVCEGVGDEHRRIEVKGQLVKCPNGPRSRR
jgi:hypothetical protein